MKTITITLTDSRYAALSKTQSLMAMLEPEEAAKTPEEYLQKVVNGACDSYAAQYSDDTPEGLKAQLTIAQEAAVKSAVETVTVQESSQ